MDISLTRRKNLKKLERNLGIKFANPSLLNRALTHTSYAKSADKKTLPHNERLEFLGDAVLNLVAAEYLFRQYLYLSEGDLSKFRSKVVSEESLSRYALKVEIGDYILVNKDQEGIQFQPALLADTYEAIIGALYLDKGLEEARSFILDLFAKEKKKFHEIRDFKSCLQEYTQSTYKTLPRYRVIQEIGPDHSKKFKIEVKVKGKVLGKGWGLSKRKAEKMAAQSAWENITQK